MKEIQLKLPSFHLDKLIQTQNINKDLMDNYADKFSQNRGDILILNNNIHPAITPENIMSRSPFDLTKSNDIKNDNNWNKKVNTPICRICLCDDNDQNNPLINPCNCSGTMKYIHLLCLKQW